MQEVFKIPPDVTIIQENDKRYENWSYFYRGADAKGVSSAEHFVGGTFSCPDSPQDQLLSRPFIRRHWVIWSRSAQVLLYWETTRDKTCCEELEALEVLYKNWILLSSYEAEVIKANLHLTHSLTSHISTHGGLHYPQIFKSCKENSLIL